MTPLKQSCDSRAPPGLSRPRRAAAFHPHSSTTTCRRKNGRRCINSASGERGNGSRGDGFFAPHPLFLCRCLHFFFRTPTIFHFRIVLWPLEPRTRDDKRECVNSKHNNTRTIQSSFETSPLPIVLAVRRIGNARAMPSALAISAIENATTTPGALTISKIENAKTTPGAIAVGKIEIAKTGQELASSTEPATLPRPAQK